MSLQFGFGMFSLNRCSLDRDAKLSALEERADALQDGSAQFEKRAGSLKNKFWMENLKSMIMMGVVGLILLGLVYIMVSRDVLVVNSRSPSFRFRISVFQARPAAHVRAAAAATAAAASSRRGRRRRVRRRGRGRVGEEARERRPRCRGPTKTL